MRAVAVFSLLAALARAGLVQQYCSTQNTGSSQAGVYDTWQSNGACTQQCQGYSFGIVQRNYCWCSNYVPANQVDVSQCSDTCPGYPAEHCGNVGSSLFGYIYLNKSPAGTIGAVAGAGQSTTTTSVSTYTPGTTTLDNSALNSTLDINDYSPPSTYTRTFYARSTSSYLLPSSANILTGPLQATPTQPQTETVSLVVMQTVTQDQGATTVVSYVTPSSSTTSSTSISTSTSSTESSTSSSSLSTSTTISSTPVSMSAQIITLSGQVVTQTVTTTPFVASGQDAASFQQVQQKEGLSGGAIAGIVIGVLAGIAALVIAAFLLWRRRRQQQDQPTTAADVTSEKPPPKRNTSVLSRSGLLARGNDNNASHHVESNPFDEPANGGTTSQRHSMLFGAGGAVAEGVSPSSPLGTSYSGDSRRHSKPMVYDQRLNPSALFGSHDNGSRVSMQDGADYSRTLGVTNPDPRASWDSHVSR